MNLTQGRVAAVAAGMLGVFLFLTVATVDVPHGATDAELLAWWQQAANRWSGVFSGLSAVGVAISAAVLRTGLAAVPGTRGSAWMAFGRTMAVAVSCLWLVTGAVRAAIGHLVDVTGEPLPGVDVLRMVTAINYVLLGLSGMAAMGLMMLGVSVSVLRAGAPARWVGRLGLGCAAVVLLATLAQYGAYVTLVAILWSWCLAVALWRDKNQPQEVSVTSAIVASSTPSSAAASTVNATP
jgi:hypothetical protein